MERTESKVSGCENQNENRPFFVVVQRERSLTSYNRETGFWEVTVKTSVCWVANGQNADLLSDFG
jgi:hypothetical protein